MEKSDVVKTISNYPVKEGNGIDVIKLCSALMERPYDLKEIAAYVGDQINGLNKDYDAILGFDWIRFPHTMNVPFATLVAAYVKKPLRLWKHIMIGHGTFYPLGSKITGEKWIGVSIVPDCVETKAYTRAAFDMNSHIEDVFALYRGSFAAICEANRRYKVMMEEMNEKLKKDSSKKLRDKLEKKVKDEVGKLDEWVRKQALIESAEMEKTLMDVFGTELHVLLTPEDFGYKF